MPPIVTRVRQRLRFPRKVATDFLVWTVATPLAFALRFDASVPPEFRSALWTFLAVSAGVKLVALLVFRFNLRSWRKVTFRDVGALALAVGAVTAVQMAFVILARPEVVVPRSVPLIDGGVSLLLLFAVRAGRRWWDERARARGVHDAASVLIFGAGEAGTLLAREMQRHPEMGLRPVGFVDDNPELLGMRIGDVPVLGGRNDLPRILRDVPVEQALIAIPSADGRFIRDTLVRVREAARSVGRRIDTRVMPGMYELLSGDVSVGRLREVRVEDLLRRPAVNLDLEAIGGYVRGRTVLVTGAGGSIGGELVRQLAGFAPARLLLLGRGENSLYEVDRKLARVEGAPPYEALVASVCDRRRVDVLFERYRPEVVIHAAAHKHVPLMEANPEEAVLNNIVGTRNVVEAALRFGAERFVNVSTDKAVNPGNVMGASKRLAEEVVRDAARRSHEGQRFVSVRFGNVLGSRGSVVPLFRRQVEEGGPVTVTDRDATRYFMTIPEAAQLVLQSGALAVNGAVYILDMGEPVRIWDLAEDVVRLSGLEPHVDVEIREIGGRAGDKVHEELLAEDERGARTSHEKIFVVPPGPASADPALRVEELAAAAARGDVDAVRTLLWADPATVPE